MFRKFLKILGIRINIKYFRNNEKILFSGGFELESTTLSNNTVDIVSSVIFIQ